ncbi:hypothetical protein M9H77_27292 [Catharanthus roseus]|uniref:Uncharacterized protein n=1 Tax=Catharanthus roseus TaxID=4058 RepID=A0ACC0AE91_CATRO|nr:hypothetical protein M9H77_27292 [Catharanthus roseus]
MSSTTTTAAAFRWLDASFSFPTSLMRWPRLFASYLRPNWGIRNSNLSSVFTTLSSRRWTPRIWLPDLDFSIVDSVYWSLVTAFESVALVSMLCFFFLFCGCTI